MCLHTTCQPGLHRDKNTSLAAGCMQARAAHAVVHRQRALGQQQLRLLAGDVRVRLLLQRQRRELLQPARRVGQARQPMLGRNEAALLVFLHPPYARPRLRVSSQGGALCPTWLSHAWRTPGAKHLCSCLARHSNPSHPYLLVPRVSALLLPANDSRPCVNSCRGHHRGKRSWCREAHRCQVQ